MDASDIFCPVLPHWIHLLFLLSTVSVIWLLCLVGLLWTGVEAGLLRNLKGPSSEAHNLGNRTPFFQSMATPSFSLPPIPSASPSLFLLPLTFPLLLSVFFFSFFIFFHHLLPWHAIWTWASAFTVVNWSIPHFFSIWFARFVIMMQNGLTESSAEESFQISWWRILNSHMFKLQLTFWYSSTHLHT